MSDSERSVNQLEDTVQDTTNRVETVNNRIEAIRIKVDSLKIMADNLKNNATAIKELDVSGRHVYSHVISQVGTEKYCRNLTVRTVKFPQRFSVSEKKCFLGR